MRPHQPDNGRPRPAPRARAAAAWLLLAVASAAQAGEMSAGRFLIKPERPYVNQPFEIRLEIELSPGAEVQDLQLEGIPLDSFAVLSAYQKEERRQVRRADRVVDVLSFVASGRPTQPVRQEFSGVLRATLVERRTTGFFSSVSAVPAGVRLAPLTVEFRPLPTANVPPGFQGAVGAFTLTGKPDPSQVAPGDIVNLTYMVTGNGWLGNAQVILPPPDPDFRVYPPQETHRDDNGQLSLRQVVVPLNTNAVRIGAARLPYFDPVAGVYREASAGPFRLLMAPPQAAGSIPAVKYFKVQPNPATSAEAGDAAVAATISHARHLLPFAVAFLLAVVIAGLLYGWRPRLAIVTGIVVFTAGVYLCQRWNGQVHLRGRDVCELAAARLCPSSGARILFHVAPGRQVTPLEVSEDWVRVDSDGQRGWIPARALKP